MEKFFRLQFYTYIKQVSQSIKTSAQSCVSFKILQTTGWLVLAEHPDQSQPTTVIADTNNRENHHPVIFLLIS